MKALLRLSLMVLVVLTGGMHRAGAQWTKSSSNGLFYRSMVQAFTISNNTVFAGTDEYGAFVSTDDGRSWVAQPILSSTDNVTAMITTPNGTGGTNIFAGIEEKGVFRSTDNGISWSEVNTNLTKLNVFSFAVSGNYLYAGTMGFGVFHSTDNGSSWIGHTRCGVHHSVALAVSGTRLLSGSDWNMGLEISYDSAASWYPANTGLKDSNITAINAYGQNIFVGTQRHGAFLSTNGGTSWAETGLTSNAVYSFAEYINESDIRFLFAGTAGTTAGVFVSTDNGTSWEDVSAGLINRQIRSLTVAGQNLVAGTWYGGVWFRSLSELTTDIEDQDIDTPSSFALRQNYPNPFTTSTSISFDIPSGSFVSLKIYDALGKEVSTLVSEELGTGQHSYQWIAEGLRSGVYLCRLQAGSYVAMQKLSLLR